MKYILILAMVFTHVSHAQVISTYDLYKKINDPGDCRFDSCFDIKTATEHAGKFSFESQEGLLGLFQARQNVKVQRSKLLPSFNLRISSPIDIFNYVPNLLGFIFPSNWYRLRESKLHSKAQEHSYVSLVANQKSTAKGLYLATHQEMINQKILQNHLRFTDKLLELMNKRFDLGEVAYEDLAELKAFNSLLLADGVIQESLLVSTSSELSYQLANVSVENISGPQELQLPDLSFEAPLRPKDFIGLVTERSPEIKSLSYLIEAARFSKRARAYEFLTPESGTENAFGFGYMANLRIARAESEELKIKKKAFETNLKKTLTVVINQYNTSIEIFTHASAIEDSLSYILNGLLSDFEASSQLDINRYISLLKENLETQQMKAQAIHAFLQARTQLERLLLETEEYASIAKTIPRNTMKLDCYLRKENKIILKALAAGELKVPDELKFENEELAFCL